MKILYSHYLTDPAHPAVQMVENISQQLRQFGHDVQIHASAGLREAAGDSSTGGSSTKTTAISQVKRRVWFAKAMARNLHWTGRDRRAIEQSAPDVVLTRQDAYCWSTVKAAIAAEIPVVTYADAPVAYETRTFNAEGRWHPPGLVERLERWVIRNSKAVLTVSHPSARKLAVYDLPTPVHVAHNGIDVARFPVHTADDRQKIRKALGLGNKVVIGFQGTFKAFHGIDRLRELMLWSSKYPHVSWLLIGDGPERETLQRDVKDKVDAKFLGRQPADQMGTLMAALDIAVAPHSQMRGDFYFCPLKILEYAASGAAVLASDQGDIPMLLANTEGGEIVCQNDLSMWTEALERLIEDDQHRAKISRIAQDHVLQNLTWKNTAIEVDRVLSEVAGRKPLASEVGSQPEVSEDITCDQDQLIGSGV